MSNEEIAGTTPPQGAPMTYPVAADHLLTVQQAAEQVGCHEETIRRAYICGALRRVKFAVRGVRIRPMDLCAWIDAGMQTRST
jgi:excisionase family DNA binding protein